MDIFADVNYQLISIDEKALEKEFIDFPKRLYKDDSNYIMPLDVDIEQVFDPTFNKAFENGACKRWLLKDNGSTIGRIAAFYTKIESTGVQSFAKI